MKQTGLVQQILEAVGFDDGIVKGKMTPCKQELLAKDADCKLANGIFSYNSLVGMLLYLS